jgi:methyl acetate hydrolase
VGLELPHQHEEDRRGTQPRQPAWAGLANTYFCLDPTLGVGGVILTQLLPFADHKVLELFAKFDSGVYAGVGQTLVEA